MPSRGGEALFFALPAVISRSGIDSAEETQPEEKGSRRARRRCPVRGGGGEVRRKISRKNFSSAFYAPKKKVLRRGFLPGKEFYARLLRRKKVLRLSFTR